MKYCILILAVVLCAVECRRRGRRPHHNVPESVEAEPVEEATATVEAEPVEEATATVEADPVDETPGKPVPVEEAPVEHESVEEDTVEPGPRHFRCTDIAAATCQTACDPRTQFAVPIPRLCDVATDACCFGAQ